MNDHEEHVVKEEKTDEPKPCCSGGDCCPSGSAGAKRWNTVLFALVVIGAGVVLANSLIRNSKADKPAQAFALPKVEAESNPPSPSMTGTADPAKDQKTTSPLWQVELDSLASLNQVATDADAVFVFLTAPDQEDSQAMTGEIEAAAQKIQAKGTQVAAFRLKHTAPEYAQFAAQVSVPCVLALVKGGGMDAVSGEISEARLMQAFVAASRPASACCAPGETCSPQQ
jgi:hypothetical protein